ncbi:MAG TPA: hypothetical protein VFN53_07555 [Acidobacteriaceae bacterium]|nr:hypothetical protein [Acidobacteriaceae bacterium]
MHRFRLCSSVRVVFALAFLLLLAGCRHGGNSFDIPANSSSWKEAKDSAREELRTLPAPSKKLYIAIHREPQWQNPFLSVGRNMIQLRIYLPDENASAVDRGGITRITAARRQVMNVRLADLPRALASLPDGAWPYGRIVAVGEGLANAGDTVQVRNNFAVTVNTVEALGLVAEEWDEPGLEH